MSTAAVRTLHRRPDAATTARWHARELCRRRAEGLADDVELIVSELVTNAVVHGSGRITLTLELVQDGVRVAVSDQGPGEPTLRRSGPDGRGRGLVLVDLVAAEWGIRRLADGGKEIWCVVLAGSPPVGSPAARLGRTAEPA